jgi:hypothetical protein
VKRGESVGIDNGPSKGEGGCNPAVVKIRDLLVASDKLRMAMKSVPIRAAAKLIHRPGTIIGKALEPLAKGEGEILVLLGWQ